MLEKPIIFSAKMVKKILGGTKTRMRCVIKFDDDYYGANPPRKHACRYKSIMPVDGYGEAVAKCRFAFPPYEVGDVLFVREPWAYSCEICAKHKENDWYCADFPNCREYLYEAGDDESPRWQSSYFMPKDIARLFLRVTDVKAKRIQEISGDEAKNEGFSNIKCVCRRQQTNYEPCPGCVIIVCSPEQNAFADLSDNLNARQGYGWGKSPWHGL